MTNEDYSKVPPPHLLKKFSEQAREDSNIGFTQWVERGRPSYCKTFAKLCIDWAFQEAAMDNYRAALAQPLLEQSDETLKFIRENTPRYQMSVTISTHDSAIDTRLHVIWSALDLSKEILESVSLPGQLPPLGNK
jgi:hypothetical protein